MLYDEKRIPFSNRTPRAAFVDFMRESFNNFPFIGTFESYIFILGSIFGPDSTVFFEVPSPGIIQIDVDANSDIDFQAIGYEPGTGIFLLGTQDDDELVFRSIPGITNEAELELLFAELVPAGIVPHVNMNFIERYFFVADEGGPLIDMLDSFGNNIIFYEIG